MQTIDIAYDIVYNGNKIKIYQDLSSSAGHTLWRLAVDRVYISLSQLLHDVDSKPRCCKFWSGVWLICTSCGEYRSNTSTTWHSSSAFRVFRKFCCAGDTTLNIEWPCLHCRWSMCMEQFAWRDPSQFMTGCFKHSLKTYLFVQSFHWPRPSHFMSLRPRFRDSATFVYSALAVTLH